MYGPEVGGDARNNSPLGNNPSIWAPDHQEPLSLRHVLVGRLLLHRVVDLILFGVLVYHHS